MNCFTVKTLFCVIYIPPEGSIYSNIDIFDTLESDLTELNPDNDLEICLLGKINSHSNNDSDCVLLDNNIIQNIDMHNIYDIISIEELGFTGRFNSDNSQIDNNGHRLLEICRWLNINIANGRLGSDKFLGRKTCKASTVVDYAVLSPLLFTLIEDFKILPFDPMMSDVHCCIFISLSCRPDEHLIMNDQIENVNTTIHRATLDVSKQDFVLLNLDNDDIPQFINHMDSLDGNYTKKDVDLLTSQCASLLYTAADVTGLIKSSNSVVSSILGRRTSRNITRPWFDHECRRMQLKYLRIKNLRRRVSDTENYQALNDASRDYKNVYINILLHTKKI